MTTTRGPLRKPSPSRLSTTRRRAEPSISPFGALRSASSTNPMSLSPGRESRWQRRGESPRKENGCRRGENRSVDHEGGMPSAGQRGPAICFNRYLSKSGGLLAYGGDHAKYGRGTFGTSRKRPHVRLKSA